MIIDPVTIFASVPPARNAPPTMPSCHSAIGASRSHRRKLSRGRLAQSFPRGQLRQSTIATTLFRDKIEQLKA